MADARPTPPSIGAFGDSAVVVDLPGPLGLETSARVHAVARAIAAATAGRRGWGRPVPAATSVLVTVDPLDPGVEAAEILVRAAVAEAAVTGAAVSGRVMAEASDAGAWPAQGPVIEIPVRYGGPDGPDLAVVAELARLSPEDVVELHAGVTYRALFLGFAPGFAYLGVVPSPLVVPRRSEPRVRVPAGSVGLAGEQTAVYPAESPGGWQLIGRTSRVAWDPRRSPPALIAAGDAVRFVPER